MQAIALINSKKKKDIAMKNATIIPKQLDDKNAEQLAKELNVSLLVAKLLLTRNITTPSQAKSFLSDGLESLYSPFLLTDMDKAVEIILESLERKEKICIYGDYDVDGITATSLLLLFFREMKADVIYHLPHRIRDGYGLNENAVRELKAKGVDLIITVDTGISAVKEVALAKEIGLKIVVTDHHECQAIIPSADAVIDPKRPDDAYPFKEIAGVGVAFKLITAITEKVKQNKNFPQIDVERFIELVAIGTVSDLMPLVSENRILVREALSKISETQNEGLKALLDVAEIEPSKLNSTAIGFRIGPRLNAAGRMGDAARGVELFTSQNMEKAMQLAAELNEENKNRQDTENKILQEAFVQVTERAEKFGLDKVLVVAGEGWHHGVVGIVASRILERYYRPVIVLAIEGDKAVGSARSVEGFNLFEALVDCQELFLKFGGHEMAAGMTLLAENIDVFRSRMNDYAKLRLTPEILTRKEKVDFEVKVSDLTVPFIEELQMLEPYGVGNPEPKFLVESHLSEIRRMGKEQQHLRLGLTDRFHFVDGVAFFEGQEADHISPDFLIKATGNAQVNEWNGRKKAQIMLSYFSQKEPIYQFSACLYEDIKAKKQRTEIVSGVDREFLKKQYLVLKKNLNGQEVVIPWQMILSFFGKRKKEELAEIMIGMAVFEELGICRLKWTKQELIVSLIEGIRVELEKSEIYGFYKS